MPGLKIGMILLTVPVILVCLALPAVSQVKSLRGIVKDLESSKPVRNVNVRINGTTQGVVTDQDGRFTLKLKQVPASVILSCIGYETLRYDFLEIPDAPVELIMKRSASTLPEVDIRAIRFSDVFRDRSYSVLDYEIMGEHLLLLVFRHQRKNAELIAITTGGDTVFIAGIPQQKPVRLYKDFLGNIHYVSSKGYAYQCIYDERMNTLVFPYRTTFDSLVRMAKPFLFTSGGRTWFEEYRPGGYGKAIGYFDHHQKKTYVRYVSAGTSLKRWNDDLKFNAAWNQSVGSLSDNSLSYIPLAGDDDLRANKLFYYQKVNAPLVRLADNRLAVFNFTDDMIEIMDGEGKTERTIPIDFHKEANTNLVAGLVGVFIPLSTWEWSGKLHIDEHFGDVYTVYHKHGLTRIRKIDPETGKLTRSYDIPVPFPEKIGIFKGEAYFLYKEPEFESISWRLGKVKL